MNNEIDSLAQRFAGAQEWLCKARTRDKRHVAESEMLRLSCLLQEAHDHDGPRGTGSAEPSQEL